MTCPRCHSFRVTFTKITPLRSNHYQTVLRCLDCGHSETTTLTTHLTTAELDWIRDLAAQWDEEIEQ